MDFHAAMETFAEAWVAANTQTVVNPEGQPVKQSPSSDELPSQLPRDQLQAIKTSPTKQPPPGPQQLSPSSSGSTKSLPIHCIIEQTSGQPSFETSSSDSSTHNNSIELDSYAILPGTTLLSECVRAALLKLGYSSIEAMGAKGAIQVKNWKPLTFEAITDEKTSTIEDILGELTQIATLRIRICSAVKTSSAEEVKEKLLQLLLNQSHSLLTNAGCPIEKDMLASISNGANTADISREMRRAFDRWYNEQLKHPKAGSNGNVNIQQINDLVRKAQERPINSQDNHENHGPNLPRPVASSTPTSPMSHYLPGKTRMRTSFDPEHEIPRLQKWFVESQHPSREQMLHYLGELNSLESRKGRRPLDLTNIIYWFKNARAAHRRANKSMDEDSFEMEEEKEMTVPASTEPVPYLPNRNAVYMLPYSLHPNLHQSPHLSHGLPNGHIEYDREPCDLSMNKKPEASIARSPSIDVDVEDRRSVSPASDSGKHYTRDSSKDIEDKSETDIKVENDSDEIEVRDSEVRDCEEDKTVLNEHDNLNRNDNCASEVEKENKDISDFKMGEKPDIKNSIESESYDLENEKPKDLSNGKRRYESDDEEFDSDYEDDRSVDGSVSSHEEGKLAQLHESYLQAARQAHFNPVTSSPSSQPLHIPQFPHPLAMHYFPLNTHLYAQQANQMKYHSSQQPLSQMSKPSSGQENSSHRKRRTRVFIDPLSEIPNDEEETFPAVWTDHMVRCAVQGLLKEMNQPTLSRLSPLSQSAISNIANWKYSNTLSKDKCQEFGQWYKEYKTHGHAFSEEQAKDIRVTFHPQYELPQMRLWYKRYQNPSETKLNFFAKELNKGHVRQERPQVTVAKLKNWWKNERQKEKRISMKEGSNEKEEKEIEKLRAESLRRSARRKFIDKDSTQVKVAKVVPSPQKSPESNIQQGGSYVVPHRTQQHTASHQSVMMSSLGLSQTVTSGSHQQASNTVSPQQPSLSPAVSSGSPQQTPTGISYPIISVVDRPLSTPSGFVSLLQQNPVASENQTRNQGTRLAGNPLVIENQPRYQGQRLAEIDPGTRIGPGEYSGGGSGDGIEMRHYDF